MTNIKGISIEIGGNTEPLQKALRAVDSETKKVQSELKQVNGLLKFDPSNTELLAQKQQLLGKAIDNTSSRLDALKQAQSEVERQFQAGEIGEEAYRKFQREIVATEGKLKAFKKQAESMDAKVSVAVEIDDSKIEKLKSSMKELPDAASSAAKGAAIGIAGIGTAAAGALVGITAFVESQKEMSMDMARLSTNAEQAGMSMDKVNEAFTKVSAISGEADSAVEAVSNLLATGMNENQLAEALDYINGGAIKFSDTLKTEGIADGIQETFASGSAIGPFAELLERSGVNLETFDAGLAKAQASGEGMNYILDQMSKLGLKETYDGYMQNNQAIADYNTAQAESQRKLAELSDQLRPIVTDFMEFGNVLLDVGLGNKSLGEAFEELSSKATSAFPEIAEQGMEMFSSLVEGVEEATPELLAFIEENLPKMIDELGNLLPEFLEAGIDIVTNIIEGLAEMLPSLIESGAELLAELIGSIADKLPDVLDTGVEVVKSLIDGISDSLPQIVTTAVNLILKLASTILQNLPKIISAGGEIIGALIKGIISLAGNLGIAIVTNIIPQIWKTITGTNWASLGGDIVKGLAKGITNMAKSAVEAITGVVGSVVDKAKSLLKIKSPSRVFKEIGEWTGEGLAVGIRDKVKTVEGATADLANAVIDAMESEFGELEKIEKEQASKLAEIETNKAKKIEEIRLKASESKKELTAAQLRQIATIEEDAAKKALETEQKYAEQITKVREELESTKLKAVQDFISQKKQLEQLSIVEEAALWEQSLDAFADNSEAKVQAQIKYRDALGKVYSEISKVNEDYSSKITKINEDLAKEEKALTDAYTKAVDDRAKSLVNFTSLFEEFDAAIETSGTELLSNLKSQVDGLKKWEAEFTKLSEKAIDDGLLEELRQMGPKALGELQALNSMSDTELTEYSNLYQEKMSKAREMAIQELAPLEKETQSKIADLRNTASNELDKLNADWASKIKSLTQTTKSELNSMQDVGRFAVQGIRDGMASEQGSLEAKVREIAESIEKTTREVLQVRSPSRVMKKIGQYIGDGLIVGMEQRGGAVTEESRKLASSISDSFANTKKINLDDLVSLNADEATKELAKLNNVIADYNQTIASSDVEKRSFDARREMITKGLDEVNKKMQDYRNEIEGNAIRPLADWETNDLERRIAIMFGEEMEKYQTELMDLNAEESAYLKNFEDVQKAKFEAQKSFVEKAESLNLLSVKDEQEMYDQYANMYEKDSEQYKFFNDKSVAIRKEVKEKLTKINDDYTSKIQAANEKLIADEKAINEAYENSVKSRAQSLYSFAGIFDEVTQKTGVSGQQLINNLRSQNEALKGFGDTISSLEARGLDGALLDELEALGPKSLAEIQALNSLSDAELAEYVELWKEKSTSATAIAEQQLVDTRLKADEQITLLREETAEQLELYQNEWATAIQSVTGNTKTEMAQLVDDMPTIGANVIQGMQQGLSQMTPALVAQAEAIANAIKSTIQSALDINSPSRVMRGFGVNIGQGLVLGMDDMISKVTETSQRLSDAASNALGSLASSSAKSQAYASSTTSTSSVDNSRHFNPSIVIHTNDSGSRAMDRTLRRLALKFN